MLSEKLTLSLTCLVVLLAFGFAAYTPSVMADGNTHDFSVTITAAETMIDVSSDSGMQIASGRTRASRNIPDDTNRPATLITLLITTQEIVNLGDPDAGVTGADLTGRSEAEIAAAINEEAAAVLDDSDIKIDAYDAEGRSLGILLVEEVADVIELSHRDPNNPGKEFLLQVDEVKLTNAYTGARAGGTSLEIHTLLFSIPKGVMQQADIAHVTAVRNDGHEVHTNGVGKVYRVDLVDADEGSAAYNTGLSVTRANEGVPGVVAIQSLRERAGFIETGDFTVRVILTEEPMGGFTTDHVAVQNGSATGVVKGATLKGGLIAITENLTADPPTFGQMQRNSELTPAMVNYYSHAEAADAAATMVAATTAAGDDGTYRGTDDLFPEPTGRDNQFHQYFVTITPKAGYSGDVVVSINAFDDKVVPVPNRYVPLVGSEIVATTLSATQTVVRNSRVMNESLTVMVNTAADTTSKVALATAAYDKRKADVFDKVHNEIVLATKTYIPAGGYLVLVADRGKAGIVVDPKSKLKEKVTAAQQAFNVHGLGLPFPADDLDNFLRNGGTLNLAYKDIPEATGSDHGDSKGATGDDATGYDKANSTAYAAGALIFNEIMWGLDAGTKDSQYIELHNPGTTAIGIDRDEWVITVGAAPTEFTVIDTFSNSPASGFWEAPGSGGVTAVAENHPVVSDLVSMSRVTGSADGTAAASWVASERPSANLGGRRVGTPGAANQYTPAPTPTPTPPPPAPMVDVATGADIRVSEIMVASNEGRLAQWIELANVSSGEVSLNGWGITIDNDPDDADVVGARVNVELGDVTVDAEQVVLVVSKTSPRTSGVGMDEGDIREDRIVDVQDQVSDEDRYSLISEMAFKISLIPPQTSGVVEPGDVVGNLGEGWELPMSEDGRSSLIRREMDAAAMAQMGTSAAGWILASSTKLDGAYRTTYYGDDEDVGTPGYNAGGPLPVELSSFYPKRSEETGHVEITWKTQSELNNAGFFIKRSQQRDGKFVVVNPTMIPGAGTTSEEQSYTYTDTTAQPNVIYYYQIEDVSLDGQRQTLTLGTRLRGHIGAAGKATTIWGELKSQE